MSTITREQLNFAQKLLLVKNLHYVLDIPSEQALAWANEKSLPVKGDKFVQAIMLALTAFYPIEHFAPDLHQLQFPGDKDIVELVPRVREHLVPALESYLDLYIWEKDKATDLKQYWADRGVEVRTEHHHYSTDVTDPEKTTLEIWLLRVVTDCEDTHDKTKFVSGQVLVPTWPVVIAELPAQADKPNNGGLNVTVS